MLAEALAAATLICLDPGHGTQPAIARQREAIGPGSRVTKIKDGGGAAGEAEVVLAIARRTRTLLLRRGYRVAMTRTGPTFRGGNIERAQFCNRRGAALMLRIHADGSTDPSRRGVSTLYPALRRGWTDDVFRPSLRAARAIQRSLVRATGAPDRGLVERSGLTGFNWADVPVVLVETGFMTNPTERRLLRSSAYQQRIALGLASGVTASSSRGGVGSRCADDPALRPDVRGPSGPSSGPEAEAPYSLGRRIRSTTERPSACTARRRSSGSPTASAASTVVSAPSNSSRSSTTGRDSSRRARSSSALGSAASGCGGRRRIRRQTPARPTAAPPVRNVRRRFTGPMLHSSPLPALPAGASRMRRFRGKAAQTEGREEFGNVTPYEILLMLDPEIPEERQTEIVQRTRELVERGGGTIETHDAWGRRKLAYEIDHKTDGTYHLLTFTAETETLEEISRILKITDGVMRHLAVRRSERGPGQTVAASAPARQDGAEAETFVQEEE